MVVRNERHRIEENLKYHMKYFDEVAICDQSSDDGTFEVLEAIKQSSLIPFYLWQDKAHGNCEPSSNKTKDMLTTDWLVWIDADEKFPEDFLNHMHDISDNPNFNAYWLKRQNSFEVKVYDESIPVEPKTAIAVHEKIEYQLRFARRKFVDFPPFLHHRMRVKNEKGEEVLGKLPFFTIIHRKTLEEQLLDNSRYKK